MCDFSCDNNIHASWARSLKTFYLKKKFIPFVVFRNFGIHQHWTHMLLLLPLVLICTNGALGAKVKFNDYFLLFDGPFSLNFCVHECCPLVDHVDSVCDPMRPWNGRKWFLFLVSRRWKWSYMDENGYLYTRIYWQMLHMWSVKCLYELLFICKKVWWKWYGWVLTLTKTKLHTSSTKWKILMLQPSLISVKKQVLHLKHDQQYAYHWRMKDKHTCRVDCYNKAKNMKMC